MVAQCYDQNGNVSGDFPCDPDADTSTCCGQGSLCINNLYCTTPWNSNVPGTCTDQNWGTHGYLNPSCPCPPHYLSDGSPLSYLGDTTLCSDGGFVCGVNNSTGCENGTPNPVIFFGNAVPVPSSTSQLSSYYSSLHLSTSTVASRATTTSTITSTTASFLTSSTISTSLVAAAVATDASSTAAANNAGGLDSSAKIGLGVGIALGVLVLALLGALIAILRRRQKTSHAASRPTGPDISYAAITNGYQQHAAAYHSPQLQPSLVTGPGELEAYAPMLQKSAVAYEAAAVREPGELPTWETK